MTRPLYLHIGLQKTGTSYLQGLFLGNVDALRGAGLDVYPTQRRAAYSADLRKWLFKRTEV